MSGWSSAGSPPPSAPRGGEPIPPPGSLGEVLLGVVRSPTTTLRSIAHHPDLRRTLLVVVVLNVVTGVVFVATTQPFPGIEPDPLTRWVVEQRGSALLFAVVAAPVLGAVGYALWAGLATLLARMFGGTGTFVGTFAALVFAGIPPAVLSMVMQMIPATAGPLAALAIIPIGLAVAGWGIVLWVLALREAHALSTGSAVGVAVLLLLAAFVLAMLGVVIVAILLWGT